MPDLADVAAELYSLAPEDFIAARDERVKAARASGDRELATAVSKLPKPTTVAWLLNVLVRQRPDRVRELIALGDALRDAQQSLSGPELRQLSRRRHDVIEAFTGMAVAPVHDSGRQVSAALATQVRETLTAAIADPEAGEALLSGRLTKGLSYVGLGDVGADAGPGRPRPSIPAASDTSDAESARLRKRLDAVRAEVERRRDDARRADDDLNTARGRLDDARREQAEHATRVDELRAALGESEAALARAQDEQTQASTALDATETRAAQARAALEDAQASLAELEGT